MDIKIDRIIDANINRLIEGVRVVEEIARFILEDKKLTQELKNVRARVGRLSSGMSESSQIMSRDSKKDLGRYLYPESEGKRTNIAGIAAANIKRAEEAARVLEEFGKLIDPALGKEFKDIRFEIYDIEKKLMIGCKPLAISRKLDFDLYVVTDPNVLAGRPIVKVVKEIIKGGCKMVQLRDKKAPIGQYFKWAKESGRECKRAGVTFIVNDYIDVCLAIDADGVHLGQDDFPIPLARKLLGERVIIGGSAGSLEEARKCLLEGADYIGFGPVYPTTSKEDAGPASGLGLLKQIVELIPRPIIAIG
ncbi:MAG: thiamine phosphate synthase, partial [Candidatus Saganbacteria bacterium]|nr:thiamine phosphate synthase [Candidatus Saganbacteria bacterium]